MSRRQTDSRRRTRIGLACYLLLWFGVIIPGHRRGIVTADACPCCDKQSDDTHSPAGKDSRAAHCEICNFAAHLTIAAGVDVAHLPLGLLARAPRLEHVQLYFRIVLTPFDGRGPPLL